MWLLPPVMVTLAVYRLFREHREGRPSSALRAAFIALTGLAIVAAAVVGTNDVWFRAGVELRLWRVGGLARVEAFARQHVDVLRAEWQAMGGSSGRARLDQDGLKHFTFLFPPDRPEWLAPLTRYLRGRIQYDQDDLPTAIEFRLSGFDHGWGMSVHRDAQPDAAEARGINRLSDRTFLWGRP